ncbi:MAG: hypothetical protein ACI8SA_000318, partial [Dokdonia sp.]
ELPFDLLTSLPTTNFRKVNYKNFKKRLPFLPMTNKTTYF